MVTDSGDNYDNVSDSSMDRIEEDSAIIQDSQVIPTYDSSYKVYDTGKELQNQDSQSQNQDSESEIYNDSEIRDSEIEEDSGIEDSGVEVDTGIQDTGIVDTGIIIEDTGPIDSGPIDSGPIDSGPIDAGPQPCESYNDNRTYVCSNSLDCIPPISWIIIDDDDDSPLCDPYSDMHPGFGTNNNIFLEGYNEAPGWDAVCLGIKYPGYIQWKSTSARNRCVKVEVEGNRKIHAGLPNCFEWDRGVDNCLIVYEETEFHILIDRDTQPGWMHTTYAEYVPKKCPLTCE
jgi:hypothetical protein